MARGDLTREKILKAAVALFHEFGYNGTSVQDIVRKADVPKGSFYNYFQSKEELAIAASDVFYPYALALLDLENTSSPVGRLRKYFRLTLKEMQRYQVRPRMFSGQLRFRDNERDPGAQKAHY